MAVYGRTLTDEAGSACAAAERSLSDPKQK